MEPVLYLLMRTDLPSLNVGKGYAQACHAGNAFDHEVARIWDTLSDDDKILITEWRNQTTQGFGTTICLGATEHQIRSSVNEAYAEGLIADTVYDPTYPCEIPVELFGVLKNVVLNSDGSRCFHLRSELISGYIFGRKGSEEIQKAVGNLSLHP